jgi:hypothetical protein
MESCMVFVLLMLQATDTMVRSSIKLFLMNYRDPCFQPEAFSTMVYLHVQITTLEKTLRTPTPLPPPPDSPLPLPLLPNPPPTSSGIL